jgi:hypothetical protein
LLGKNGLSEKQKDPAHVEFASATLLKLLPSNTSLPKKSEKLGGPIHSCPQARSLFCSQVTSVSINWLD